MIIKTLRVKRFRCLEDESLPCDKLTALVGANGSGKSSFMRALDLFYSSTPKIVRRQLFLLLDDNYFSLSTTITS